MAYDIILADPPWTYDDKAAAGRRGACFKYPVMSTEDIADLPVNKMASKDAILFLWSTMPQLPVALVVMSAWGFTFKTVAFTWIKTNKVTPSLFWGMGRWTRSNPELVLLGVKGHPKRQSASVHSVIVEPVGRHSAKPDLVRSKIVALCGDLPRIELFARERVHGWDAWGNEVDNSTGLGDVDALPIGLY